MSVNSMNASVAMEARVDHQVNHSFIFVCLLAYDAKQIEVRARTRHHRHQHAHTKTKRQQSGAIAANKLILYIVCAMGNVRDVRYVCVLLCAHAVFCIARNTHGRTM